MPDVTLYFHETCPYCAKVLSFMDINLIEINLKNTHEKAEYRQELLEKGGKTQVPALDINGEILYESNDIIQWLKENFCK